MGSKRAPGLGTALIARGSGRGSRSHNKMLHNAQEMSSAAASAALDSCSSSSNSSTPI